MIFDPNKIETHNVPHAEESTAISTDYVIHFTSYDGLKGILKNGFRPSFIEEEVVSTKMPYAEKQLHRALNIKTLEPEKLKIPMVCFCDIPNKDIAYHKKRYGNYGIALTKSWAFTNGINPVLYLKEGTQLASIIASMDNAILEFKQTEKDTSFFQVIENELSNLRHYIKSYHGSDDKNPVMDFKFYDEREWRYYANGFICEDYWNPKKYLQFAPFDLVKIIVTTKIEKSEIHKLHNIPNAKIVVVKNGNQACCFQNLFRWLKLD
jgi:hypothetical protein